MRLLLDSHVAVWWLGDDPRLGESLITDVEDPASRVLLSAASVWELEIKAAKGRLDLPDALPAALRHAGFELLPITAEHGAQAARLPRHHADPFDRMLVAQANAEHATLVTADAAIGRYDVRVRDPQAG